MSNNRLNNQRPMRPDGPAVGLQVAVPLNDTQLVCLMATKLYKGDACQAVKEAQDIMEVAIGRMGSRSWGKRIQAVHQANAEQGQREEEEAERKRRAEMGAKNIEIP